MATRAVLAPSECTKIVFGRGSARTPLGELTTLPRLPSQLVRGYSLPIPHPLDPQTIPGLFLRALVLLQKYEYCHG